MFFPLIHRYISWFYLNQSNFSQLNIPLKKKTKGQNQDEAIASSWLMLPTALLECLTSLINRFHPQID